jgi:predicted RNase H-like HicB family nuclease
MSDMNYRENLMGQCPESSSAAADLSASGRLAVGGGGDPNGDAAEIVIEACEEGYVARMPDLPGCTGDGDTPEQAAADCRAAALEWLDEEQRLRPRH